MGGSCYDSLPTIYEEETPSGIRSIACAPSALRWVTRRTLPMAVFLAVAFCVRFFSGSSPQVQTLAIRKAEVYLHSESASNTPPTVSTESVPCETVSVNLGGRTQANTTTEASFSR